jgi:hypothetical protein
MLVNTLFKFVSESIGFELEGSESFVREQMRSFLPYVKATTGAEDTGPPEPEKGSLTHWYRETIPAGQVPTMQDHILVFAYYLYRQKRQFIFVPDDMKASFRELGKTVPKSILQIMGSLKRDQGLLYPGTKRGEYSLTPEGIRYVEGLLGIRRASTSPQEERPPAKPAEQEKGREEPATPQRDRFFSLFKEDGEVPPKDHES